MSVSGTISLKNLNIEWPYCILKYLFLYNI
jgi:hypothetical protein